MKQLLPFLLFLCGAFPSACNTDETLTPPPPGDTPDFSALLEYVPAPGQFINDAKQAGFGGETTAEAALAYAERRLRAGEYVSLGGWGGYLVADFGRPIANDGGANLLIEGNAFATSSEPGIVWVMRDENDNGLPDDTWYELAGSEASRSIREYEVTYRRPEAEGDPVPWSDNRNGSGTIDRTPEHPQAYYPAWITTDSYTLRGTLLPANVAHIDGQWSAEPFAWGYVDNYGKQDRNLFRIQDAVDAQGQSVSLPDIRFVKIQTGINAQAPAIGEISTEVRSIRDYNLLK